MKRVLVIGSGGAGKSTFSRHLGSVLGIEVVHLDKLYWQPDWVKTPKDEWQKTVEGLLKGDSWILDGNFGGSREIRMKACDTIIFMDIPRRICLYRILKRSLIYRNKTRPDMAEGCYERFDLDFVMWVWRYPGRAREHILEQFERFRDKDIIVLKTKSEISEFLQQCRQHTAA